MIRVLMITWLLLKPFCAHARDQQIPAFRTRIVALLAAFWPWLRKLRKRIVYGPGRHCPAPAVLRITAADIGLADWKFSPQKQSWRIEDTMPAMPAIRIPAYLTRSA